MVDNLNILKITECFQYVNFMACTLNLNKALGEKGERK